eukprot:TRINITY_DN9817_c0_g1_i1.p1 TRINITY_DN9817_c0_g1~~TRINITY_DN9817_c0_g1_i1.p1  ORF type:complete len:101 (-),score=4.51 TRINITY_DN9817_c0_g1_i1:1042-1344(-)
MTHFWALSISIHFSILVTVKKYAYFPLVFFCDWRECLSISIISKECLYRLFIIFQYILCLFKESNMPFISITIIPSSVDNFIRTLISDFHRLITQLQNMT